MELQEQVLSPEKLQGMLGVKGALGRQLSKLLVKVLEIDKVNTTQAKFAQDNAPDFAAHVLQEVGVRYSLPEGHLDRIPAEGGFITVSNHHFGSLDGLILCDTVYRKRPDYKILTTFMLSLIPNLKELFLPVDNLSGKQDARSVNSIRTALRHIAEGGGMGFFPAGEVATFQKGEERSAICEKPVIEDKPWAANIIKLIKKSGLPVVPIYFDGENSANFHRLGKIHPRLRTLRLIHELFNKEGTLVKVRIGQPILPAEVEGMDLETFGNYLRSRTYALEASCREETPSEATPAPMQPIAEAEDPALIREEIARIQDRVLFESGDYRCYLTPAADIPHTMRELARLREMIFRAVGEGTGLPLDTDGYDALYRHLILWNVPEGEIAGAYRIGVGSELMERPEGKDAFYTASLFQFQEGMLPYLHKGMELGRTIIIPKYQRDVTTLKLLLTGILTAGAKFEKMEYSLGPASISNAIPHFYKSLIYHYILKNHSLPEAPSLLQPKHPFQPDFLRVNPDHLLVGCKSIDDLDHLLVSLSDGEYRPPVLLRKYISFGSKFVCFNVDPDFCNALDGFVLLWLGDMPENTYRSFSKFLTEEEAQMLKERLHRA